MVEEAYPERHIGRARCESYGGDERDQRFVGRQGWFLAVDLLQGIEEGLCRSLTDGWVVQRHDLEWLPKVEGELGHTSEAADDGGDKSAASSECSLGGSHVECITLDDDELSRESLLRKTLGEQLLLQFRRCPSQSSGRVASLEGVYETGVCASACCAEEGDRSFDRGSGRHCWR